MGWRIFTTPLQRRSLERVSRSSLRNSPRIHGERGVNTEQHERSRTTTIRRSCQAVTVDSYGDKAHGGKQCARDENNGRKSRRAALFLHFSAFRKLHHNCFSVGCCSSAQPRTIRARPTDRVQLQLQLQQLQQQQQQQSRRTTERSGRTKKIKCNNSVCRSSLVVGHDYR